MTLKEKLETIKGKKIAIWCEEEWMADKLFEAYGDESSTYYWDDDICYDLKEEDYFMNADKEYYENTIHFEVIPFKNFSDGTNTRIELTQADINTILDGKYGKDNWVIK